MFCNPFPKKEDKDLVQQTGSLLGTAQQCSLCLIPKISLVTGAGKRNWGRIGPGTGRQQGSSGGAGSQGFGRQPPPLQGAALTMRDVSPSLMPEVLFLLAKGGNRGKTIQWCPAAHTATKELVHLKTATPTTLKSSCQYHQQLLARSSSSQLLLPIMTLLFRQCRRACYLGQLGAVAASPPSSHPSCLIASSRCLAATPAGTQGAVGHLGLSRTAIRDG